MTQQPPSSHESQSSSKNPIEPEVDATTAMISGSRKPSPHSVRTGCSLLLHKLDNQEIPKTRTDRVREIFKYLKASKSSKRRSGRGQLKRKLLNTDTIRSRDEDPPAQPKERKVLSFEERRIRYGISLIRKRNNKDKWRYDPALEPYYNVKRFGQEEYDDEDEDYHVCEIVEFGDYYDFQDQTYSAFDESGKRLYASYLKGKRSCDFLKELFQKTLECSSEDVHALDLDNIPGGKTHFLIAFLTEEEADRLAGLKEVLCVAPI